MRRRRWFAIAGLLAGVFLLVGAVLPAFPDLTGHVYELPIRLLARRGVVQGFPDGSFRPFQFLTRGELAKLLAVALGDGGEASRLQAAPPRFSDMAGHWGRGYVEMAAELGLVQGFPDGTFKPDQPVTRAELVVIAARAAGLAEKAGQAPPDAPVPYRDAEEIPPWARPYVWAAAEEGLLDGLFPGRLLPNRGATRAEAAALVARLAARQGRFYDLSGTVVAWDPEERLLTVETGAGERKTLRLAPDALVIRGGAPAEEIRPLDQVWAALGPGDEVEFLDVRFQDLLGESPRVEGNRITFVEKGKEVVHTVSLTPATRIFVNGRPATVQDLHGVQWVYVVRDLSTGAARILDAVRYTHYGMVTWTDPEEGWLGFQAEDGPYLELRLAPDAALFYQGHRITPEELPPGVPVAIEADRETVRYLQVDDENL